VQEKTAKSATEKKTDLKKKKKILRNARGASRIDRRFQRLLGVEARQMKLKGAEKRLGWPTTKLARRIAPVQAFLSGQSSCPTWVKPMKMNISISILFPNNSVIRGNPSRTGLSSREFCRFAARLLVLSRRFHVRAAGCEFLRPAAAHQYDYHVEYRRFLAFCATEYIVEGRNWFGFQIGI
jgi:hypothetical protein